jgi:hypothetical protein
MVVEPVVLPFPFVRAEVVTADELATTVMVVEPVVLPFALVRGEVVTSAVVAPPAPPVPDPDAEPDAPEAVFVFVPPAVAELASDVAPFFNASVSTSD